MEKKTEDFTYILDSYWKGRTKGKRDTLEKIAKLLSNENTELQSKFYEFLVNNGERAVKPLVETLAISQNQTSLMVMEVLGEIGDPRAIYALASKLKNKDWKVRGGAVLALGKIDHPKAVKILIKALKDKNFTVRRNAALALGEMKSREAVDPLIKALEDKDWQVRRTAAWALGEIKDPKAVTPLTKRLKDKDREVVIKTIDSLRTIGDPRAVKDLVAAMREKGEIRYKAVWALGEIADPSVVEPLVTALKDPDWRVQKRAGWALRRISGEEEESEPDIEL
ncbi:MAG: HEAT repeat domain-containing protein [Candidatus Jordarchaeum sp.]|uniref:HEAT repeat domain-containing protein n=1 Tax=Candidatus Jordarchaeum sp. TaxID=2823881 RepID=UPI00404A2227